MTLQLSPVQLLPVWLKVTECLSTSPHQAAVGSLSEQHCAAVACASTPMRCVEMGTCSQCPLISLVKREAPKGPPMETARMFGVSPLHSSAGHAARVHGKPMWQGTEGAISRQHLKFLVQEPEKWNRPINCGKEAWERPYSPAPVMPLLSFKPRQADCGMDKDSTNIC